MSELPFGTAGHGDPFLVLGLPAEAGLTDEDVRAAWRRIAAATHPDREDGGDPARFGAAAAAYALLRTSFGRGEALADRTADVHPRPRPAPRSGRPARPGAAARRTAVARQFRAAGRAAASHGRTAAQAGAGTGAAVAVAVGGWTPATIGLLAGAVTLVLATGWDRWRRGGRGR
jgi:curved DNA-binding protein CbpA